MNFHVKTLLVGTVTVALCAAVFVWIVVLDKGTLTVVGETPYSIEVDGGNLKVSEKKNCSSDRCSLSVPKGDYEVTLTKTGYFDESRSVSILRQQATTLEVAFTFIPTVESLGNLETVPQTLALSFEEEDPSEAFTFEWDATYEKQHLVYTDPETDESTTWAYFDRTLTDPLVIPHPDLEKALVVDREGGAHSLYLVDGVNFERSYLGALMNVEDAEWNIDGSMVLVKTADSLWLVTIEETSLMEWALAIPLGKVVWDGEGRLVFATDENLEAAEEAGPETTFEILKEMLSGGLNDEAVSFVIGQYDPVMGNFKVIYEVPASLEINYDSVRMVYDSLSEGVYFTDEIEVYSVTRS